MEKKIKKINLQLFFYNKSINNDYKLDYPLLHTNSLQHNQIINQISFLVFEEKEKDPNWLEYNFHF